MSFGSTGKWLGGMNIGNWFVDSLGMSHFTTSASITEYWQGMVLNSSVLNLVPSLATSSLKGCVRITNQSVVNLNLIERVSF